MKLEGQVALITGAASGIGRASATLFASEGAKVMVADVNSRGGRQTVKMIKDCGGEAAFVHTDVAVVADIEKAVKATIDTFGKLTTLFSNAGIAGPGLIEETDEAGYDRAMTVNLKAGFFAAKYAVPQLRKAGGGCILFTSSGLGLKPSPVSVTYSLAKAGLVMLTRSLASSLGKDNIRVNAVCPGPVTETPLFQDFASRHPGTDPALYAKASIEGRPIARSGTVTDVALAALFLVSPENSYITGVALPVDGGGVAK